MSIQLVSPLQGQVVALTEIPDPVFAEEMIGPVVAIRPTEGKVVAPFAAEVATVFPTKHAIGLVGENGLEVLIHIGVDTVSLEGKGFEQHVTAGQKVAAGDLLVSFDVDFVAQNALSIVTPVIFTNADQIASLEKAAEGDVTRGQSTIATVSVK